jgi:hypothetical protein
MAKRYKSRQKSTKKTKFEKREDYSPATKKESLKKKTEKMPTTVQEEEVQLVERFDKAFLISLGLIALFSLLIFIPFLGPVMLLSVIPYISCNIGCRYVSKRNGIQVGILLGIIWSIVEFYLLFQFLREVMISVSEPAIKTTVDVIIIVLIFTANLIFCIIGGYTGGAKFEEANKDKFKILENVQMG